VPAGGLTVETLRRYLNSTRTESDPLLELLLDSGAEFAALPQATGRYLFPYPELVDGEDNAPPVTKKWETRGRRRVPVQDVREVTEVKLDGTVVTDYELVPWPKRLPGCPAVAIELHADGDAVEITGRFGFLDFPAVLQDAVYTLVARNYNERAALYADAADLGEGGMVNYFRVVPPRVRAVFDNFRVPAGMYGLR
jgi:hypothetical protein